MLVIDSYLLKLNKTTNSWKFHRCNDVQCRVIVHTDLNDLVQLIKSEHWHSSEPEAIEIRTFQQAVKTRAINETTPIPQMDDEEALRMSMSKLTIAVLPSQREISQLNYHYSLSDNSFFKVVV